jgi:glutamine cyclotransferase
VRITKGRPADSEAVLNGIAYLPQSNHLLITGKLWPKLYEIEVIEQPPKNQ